MGSLEAVVQDHMVLSQIPENLGAWFEKHGFNVMHKPDSERGDALEELKGANEVVLCESGVGDGIGFCSVWCLISAKAHIGGRLRSFTTQSLRVCLHHFRRLSAVCRLDWSQLRRVDIDLRKVPSNCGTAGRHRV